MKHSIRAAVTAVATLVLAGTAGAEAKPYEDSGANNFDRSTHNELSPLKPGTRYTWNGTIVDDEGDEETLSVVFTVTDLTKVVDGVRTVVGWNQKTVDGELEEVEIAFFAPDKDGNVWLFGGYPEEYDEGTLVATSGWIHGIGIKAREKIKAEPKLGAPQGWAPDQGILELTSVQQLSSEELTKARDAALELDASGRVHSQNVYGRSELLMLDGKVAKLGEREATSSVSARGASGPPGTEEFGLTRRELVQAAESVEAKIAQCMREQGFEYVAVDYQTIRRGMSADKKLPGLTEEQFISKYGFGVSTLYTGKPPQLAEGYSPAKMGLGKRNVQIYRDLSPADRVAYTRTLFGDNSDATFAVALETENLSRTGGCTRAGIDQVFSPEQLKATFYNPKDALINQDPRMRAALRKYAARMREAGFDYNHPDDVETDVRERLDAITGGRPVPIEELPPDRLAALEELRDYERRVAAATFELEEEIFDPVEERIEKEMYAREVK